AACKISERTRIKKLIFSEALSRSGNIRVKCLSKPTRPSAITTGTEQASTWLLRSRSQSTGQNRQTGTLTGDCQGRHQPPPSQQQQNFAAHSAHDQVERFMREKTLLEQLRVRDARRGSSSVVGGLENHRLKRMQSCLEGMRLQREPTALRWTRASLRNSRAAAAPPLSRLVTAAASHSAAGTGAGRQLWRTRRSQLPLTASSLSEPPGQPQQQRSSSIGPLPSRLPSTSAPIFRQPAPLPSAGQGAPGAEARAAQNLRQAQKPPRQAAAAEARVAAAELVAGIGQRLVQNEGAGAERLRQLGLR
uniref:Kinesin motor domain-containing protein n=1 Tax=Macrostomum lignano TaxID=282301 RepID=A0A1I8FHM4_9PLAT